MLEPQSLIADILHSIEIVRNEQNRYAGRAEALEPLIALPTKALVSYR